MEEEKLSKEEQERSSINPSVISTLAGLSITQPRHALALTLGLRRKHLRQCLNLLGCKLERISGRSSTVGTFLLLLLILGILVLSIDGWNSDGSGRLGGRGSNRGIGIVSSGRCEGIVGDGCCFAGGVYGIG